MTLKFQLDDGKAELAVNDDALLAFIDETGIEDFSDPKYPIFGLGGCTALAIEYEHEIRPSWIKMRKEVFGADSLHANELKASDEQLPSIICNLSNPLFTRVVAVASSKTAFPEGHAPYNPIASCLIARIAAAATRFRFSTILVLIESGSRTNELAVRYLGPFNECNIENESGKVTVPIEYYFVPKAVNEPGLEIADFIMHIVGTQTRNRLLSPEKPVRGDFKAVIQDAPRKALEYFSIDKVEVNAA